MKGCLRVSLVFAGLVVLGLGGGYAWYQDALGPGPSREPYLLRLEKPTGRKAIIQRLANRGLVKNYQAFEIWASLNGAPESIRAGTYRISPGLRPAQVFAALRDPVTLRVRMPEGWWIARTAPLLEEAGVCSASDYIAETKKVDEFRTEFPWIPRDLTSLEGFLFPDTYLFAPEMPARDVVRMQLSNFARRYPEGIKSGRVRELVTVASLVELEAKAPDERPKVAGVIYNRLRLPMRLQIDATVLYALQEWKVLGPGVVNTIDSPYNTYRVDGLPPGAIGAPSLKSLEAALNPASHDYLFYVTREDGTDLHYFSRTYREHLANIRRSRANRRAEATP